MKIIMDKRGKKYLLKPKMAEDSGDGGDSEDTGNSGNSLNDIVGNSLVFDDFHSDLGIVKGEDISNANPGDILISHLEHNFKIIKPNVNDFIDLMERRCSILVKKDIGTVIAECGIGSGSSVVDAGTGAAAIALHFANVVGETGNVVSYEIREDFAEVAKRNIVNFANFGLNNITIKNKDVKEGIEENNLDLIFLDLPKPYEVLESAYESLATGGHIAIYAPYIEQVQISYKVAKKIGFNDIKIIETLKRELEVRTQGTRPKTRMVGHTGYLLFARKL
ncbi:MAG: tRNA (adenine-N1)-methyltransferase [Methanobacteriaceae archaeon]